MVEASVDHYSPPLDKRLNLNLNYNKALVEKVGSAHLKLPNLSLETVSVMQQLALGLEPMHRLLLARHPLEVT